MEKHSHIDWPNGVSTTTEDVRTKRASERQNVTKNRTVNVGSVRIHKNIHFVGEICERECVRVCVHIENNK